MAADRVTDQMVEAALKAWQETNVTFGDLHSLMRAAIESALRAEAGAVENLKGVVGRVLTFENAEYVPNSMFQQLRDALAQARRTDRE